MRQFVNAGIGEFDQVQKGSAQFEDIVRRDGGCHANGDTGGTISQQIGEGGRQDHRFLVLAIVGFSKIHCVQVNALQQGSGDVCHACLSIAHGGGVIPVHVSEIALTIHQRIALGEFLGQAHQGVIYCLVAMGMELTHDIADDAGAFFEAGIWVQLQLPHGIQDTPMYWLHTVAHIRQATRCDGGQGIGKVAFA